MNFRRLFFGPFILLLLLIGCAQETNDLNAEALQATAMEIVQKTEEAIPTITVPPINMPTLFTPPATKTPTVTASPTASSTPIPSATGSPTIIMTGDVNCREGPSTHYGFVTLLVTGQTATVVGRDSGGYYWVIENPNGEGQCWIWNAYSTLSGSTSRVPIMRAPSTKTPTRTPTLTPKPLASIRYYKTISCDGEDAIVVRIYNYSRRDLKSWRARIFDIPGKIPQVTEVSDYFSHNDVECNQTVNTIGYREFGYAVIRFDENSAVRYLIEFEICTKPGKLGDCLFYGFYLNNPNIPPTPTSTITPTPSETP